MNRTSAPFRVDPVLRDLSNQLHAVDRADSLATAAVECPGLLEFRDALAAVAADYDTNLRRLRDAWMESPGHFMREISDQLADALAEGAQCHNDALECDAREVLGDW